MKKLLTSVALTLVTLSSFANYAASFQCTATATYNFYDQNGTFLGSTSATVTGDTCAGAMSVAKSLASHYIAI